MTRDVSSRRFAPVLALLAALISPTVHAQSVDCAALRAQLDAAAPASDPARLDVALRQQQEEIARTRAYADQSGCGDGVFDDPDSPQCRSLARRIGALEAGLQRLQDQASRGDPAADDRRRSLQDAYNAECSTERASTDGSAVTMPVNRDVPPPEAAPAPDTEAPAASPRSTLVLCVRHCDGAYYPLATDVPSDHLGDMDRICQAQCPAAASSAYAGRDLDDIAGATASDGTRYSDLATAFQFRKAPTSTCACRGPKQSWAEALAGAEAMLEPHKGDVTVTPALQAEMSRPVAPPPVSTPRAKSSPTVKKAPRKAAAPADVVPPAEAPSPLEADRDFMRQLRRSGPTL